MSITKDPAKKNQNPGSPSAKAENPAHAQRPDQNKFGQRQPEQRQPEQNKPGLGKNPANPQQKEKSSWK